MTQLEQIKADMLTTFKDELCEESVIAINKASTMEEFIGLLSYFYTFLKYKELPTIEWVKKWFGNLELRKVARENGVYFDGWNSISNPTKPIVVMGDAKLSVYIGDARVYNIYTKDSAVCEITTFSNCFVKVRQKAQSKVNILHKHNLSRIKINKI